MGEIRSTLELMMERTRGMSLSSEEKEDLKREELEKRAKGFRLRFVDGTIEADEILSTIDEEPNEDGKRLQSLLWKELVESLPLDQTMLKFLDLMEKLPQGEAKARIIKDCRSSMKDLGKIKAKDRKKLAALERKKLASFGISGTAVIPKLSDDTTAGSKAAARMEEFKSKLRESPSDESSHA